MAAVEGHHYDAALLTHSSVVLDLGAHRGAFSLAMVRQFGCRAYAIEANATLCRTIPILPGLSRHHLAVSSHNGVARLRVSQMLSASSIESAPPNPSGECQRVRCSTVLSFLRKMHVEKVDLLKLDVEGSEIPILSTLPLEILRRITQITVEFHDLFDRSPSTLDRIMNVRRRMLRAGFFAVRYSVRTWGDVLFLNRKLCGYPDWRLWRIALWDRNLEAATRFMGGHGG